MKFEIEIFGVLLSYHQGITKKQKKQKKRKEIRNWAQVDFQHHRSHFKVWTILIRSFKVYTIENDCKGAKNYDK